MVFRLFTFISIYRITLIIIEEARNIGNAELSSPLEGGLGKLLKPLRLKIRIRIRDC